VGIDPDKKVEDVFGFIEDMQSGSSTQRKTTKPPLRLEVRKTNNTTLIPVGLVVLTDKGCSDYSSLFFWCVEDYDPCIPGLSGRASGIIQKIHFVWKISKGQSLVRMYLSHGGV
jgi:hypothetical protein